MAAESDSGKIYWSELRELVNGINFFVGMKLKIGSADKKHSVFFPL